MKKGFTLAEVLITLGIIGVVAAFTIPTLMANYQKQQYLTSLKKFYSQFNQVLTTLAKDYDCPGDLGCTGVFTNSTTMGDAITKYFNVVKNCTTAHNQGCMSNKTNNYYDGSGPDMNLDNNDWGYRFITVEGYAMDIDGAGDCSGNASSGKTGNLTKTCGTLAVDINGPQKGPNIYGRDTFNFRISNGRGPLLYPIGGADDGGAGWWKNNGCGTAGTKSAPYCAGKILEENWQMNY